ncbi:MAG: DEAD/DEAH box helicase [Myxococcaceae bacterium]|nr:DEAD/DEAH box helicase [Myxococcaceae bacterium]MBH2005923.1 DEAD/DEAH box helicase [Myxococcaceae bacterium]
MFNTFGFSETLLKAIARAGFEKPSPIQEQAIPLVMAGRDLIGQAKTGTGKTAAFGLPALEKIDPHSSSTQLLVLTPTRELCTQVCEEIQRFGRTQGIRCVPIYGGSSYARQIDSVKQGAHVIVATPGRLLDLMNSRRIPKLKPTMVVLDEADEMLDMGFLEDIQAIFEHIPKERQTLLFSATMPSLIQKLAKKILNNPEVVTTNSGKEITNQNIEQLAFLIEESEREDALVRLIDAYRPFKSIVFCRTKADVDALQQSLVSDGHASAALHGDIEQRQRERVTAAFREGRIQVLIATDVAARGLNITDVSHVFNYHLPGSSETYVHRIGRTARAGKSGVSLSLVVPKEAGRVRQIEQCTGSRIAMKFVPSLQEVKQGRLSELVTKLEAQPTSKEARLFLEKLEDKSNLEETLLKLLSLYLSQMPIAGPEKIGLNPERLSKSESEKPERSRGKRFFNKSNPRFGNRAKSNRSH